MERADLELPVRLNAKTGAKPPRIIPLCGVLTQLSIVNLNRDDIDTCYSQIEVYPVLLHGKSETGVFCFAPTRDYLLSAESVDVDSSVKIPGANAPTYRCLLLGTYDPVTI